MRLPSTPHCPRAETRSSTRRWIGPSRRACSPLLQMRRRALAPRGAASRGRWKSSTRAATARPSRTRSPSARARRAWPRPRNLKMCASGRGRGPRRRSARSAPRPSLAVWTSHFTRRVCSMAWRLTDFYTGLSEPAAPRGPRGRRGRGRRGAERQEHGRRRAAQRGEGRLRRGRGARPGDRAPEAARAAARRVSCLGGPRAAARRSQERR